MHHCGVHGGTGPADMHAAPMCLRSHEVEIEVLTQDITRLFRKVEARLQQFGSGDATSEADEKVRPCTALLATAHQLHVPSASIQHLMACRL